MGRSVSEMARKESAYVLEKYFIDLILRVQQGKCSQIIASGKILG